MNRNQYNEARKLVRENGAFAYRWMSPQDAHVMHSLVSMPDDAYNELVFFKRSHRAGSATQWLHARYRLLNRI